jgi:dipeptidyl aminopeptidase/acylaminoacyl peptidase
MVTYARMHWTLALASLGIAAPTVRAQTVPPAAATARPSATSVSFTPEDALAVVSYNAGDLSPDGKWLAATSAVRRDGFGVDYRRDGDPTYIRPGNAMVWIIDTESGAAKAVFPDKRNVRNMEWSPDGSKLAMLVVRGDAFEPIVWERTTGKTTTVRPPAGTYLAENSELRWTRDGRSLVFAVRSAEWKKKQIARFEEMTRGPVFVQSSTDPFLAWDEIRRQGSVRSIIAAEIATGKTRELIPESRISTFTLGPGDTVLTFNEDITKKTDYDVIFGTENRLVRRSLNGGTSKVLLPSLKNTTVVWSQDGSRYAYGREGRVYLASLGDSTGRQIAGAAAADSARAASDTSREARDRRANERFTPIRLSANGDALLLSNRQGIWLMNLATSAREMIVETSDSSATAPRQTVAAWSDDGRYIYLTYASRAKWERGFSRYDVQAKRLEPLVRDGRIYSGLRLSKDGHTAVMSVADGNRPGDLYVSDPSLANPRRLTDANPSLRGDRLGKTELVNYLDVDGKTRYAVVYLPPNFQRGTRYPTVFNVYEDFFDDTFDPAVDILTANGYVVVKPSVGFEIGFPGEAWAKGVTSAANKLIEMGIADSSRLGVHGTSYGGYATNLLITQTDRFKAAINISGKVDIISFYTDSPRLGVRNLHAAEKSQDRLGATLWQQPQKYVQHSAIFFADRIKTPLLLLTGAQDSNVPADNTREMYYALRRLNKEVVWVNYLNGGHGAGNSTAEEFVDMQNRIVGWYDKYLKRDQKKTVTSNDGSSR